MSEPLTQYIRDLYAREDEALLYAREEMARLGMPLIHIQPEEGRMLQFLLMTIKVRRVIEIGTLAGYSGLWIVRALPAEGILITLEHDESHAEVARRVFEQAGAGHQVDIRVGPALETLSLLASDGPFDALFIDADKPSYPAYLDWALDHIRSGGLIMAHNAFLRGEVIKRQDIYSPHLEGIRTFNRRLAEDDRLEGVILPVGDGIAAAIRK